MIYNMYYYVLLCIIMYYYVLCIIIMFCFVVLNFGFRSHYYRGVLPCNGYPFNCVALVTQGQGTLFLES